MTSVGQGNPRPLHSGDLSPTLNTTKGDPDQCKDELHDPQRYNIDSTHDDHTIE